MLGARRFQTGLSLIEVMVASVLSLVTLSVLISVLIPTLRSSKRISNRVELQQIATLTLSRIARDLDSSASGAISMSRHSLCIHPIQSVASDGAQVYSESVLLYSWEQTERLLLFRKWRDSSISIDYPFTIEAEMIAPLMNESSRPIARKIRSFTIQEVGTDGAVVTETETPAANQSYIITVGLESEKESFQLSRQVTLHASARGI